MDQKDFREMTPLHYAASSGFPEIFSYLYYEAFEKCPVDRYGQTPMHLAALQENPDLVEFLINLYGTVDYLDGEGNTPLHYSTVNFKIFQIIYEQAQEKQPKNHKGQTPLVSKLDIDR